jgi:hypothetical protein
MYDYVVKLAHTWTIQLWFKIHKEDLKSFIIEFFSMKFCAYKKKP